MARKHAPEIVEQVRKYAADGLSAAQASAKMDGFSRCAIIGIASRSGIKFDGYVPGTDRKRNPVVRKPKMIKLPKPAPKLQCAVPEEKRVGMLNLIELKEDSCRYPYDTRDGMRYCGEATYTDPVRDKRYSWCSLHCLTVYQPR